MKLDYYHLHLIFIDHRSCFKYSEVESHITSLKLVDLPMKLNANVIIANKY